MVCLFTILLVLHLTCFIVSYYYVMVDCFLHLLYVQVCSRYFLNECSSVVCNTYYYSPHYKSKRPPNTVTLSETTFHTITVVLMMSKVFDTVNVHKLIYKLILTNIPNTFITSSRATKLTQSLEIRHLHNAR